LGVVHLGSVSLSFSKLTYVSEFLVMAVVLVARPWGLRGRPHAVNRSSSPPETPLRRIDRRSRWFAGALLLMLLVLPLAAGQRAYALVLGIDLLIAVLFAASLYFIMGPAGMPSFGHAAYFGLGAYAAALLLKEAGVPMEAALLIGPLAAGAAAFVFGWFSVRLSGVYLAMLTLAFAQIIWSLCFQWDGVTGGSSGLVGIWPSPWLAGKRSYYFLTLVLVTGALLLMHRALYSPMGYAMRAGRDSPIRADAIGVNVRRIQLAAFMVAGLFAGLAGSLFVFSKGSISPDSMAVGKSVDGLVMVLLGGLQTPAGPVVGAVVYTWLQDFIARNSEYWRAVLGAVILMLVLLFPEGIAGFIKRTAERNHDVESSQA
jgi:branched-chain amino acid transport system permease protein